ncbi:hypothetical protein QYE76_017399 [Lolium multiflorum]|uniref:Retrotransposon gag domain-containing protein n=1 Tax=Lolium multiflorum TaxID=4521 RepID=A0AAD8Q633_LOLMU|nr:hypothetical protein QYE76_017399 [Lolium multiflorum]
MDLVAQSDVLNKPIIPEEAADPEALEAKGRKCGNSSEFARPAMLEERTLAANFVGHFQKKDREVDESLATVKKLRKEWEERVACAQEEVDRIAREAIPPRKITFATPTEQQPLATPKDNMKKAAELLKKKDEEIDINYVRKLVASAMQQQSKADTSRRLASNPEQCISTAQKDAIASQHRDGESRTGSTERRRKVREHPNPIPGQEQGAYAGARTKTASLSLVGTKNATLSLAEAKDAIRNQGGAGTRSAHLSHAGAGTTEATTTKRKESPKPEPAAGATPRVEAEDHLTGPLADLPRHHPVEAEVEAEAEAGDPVPLKVTGRRPRDRLNEYRSDYIGPRCFGRMIREEPKPRSLNLKLPGNLKHYDGSERPDTWIEDYYNAVTFAGGTPNIACRMLQLYLIGPARVWLSDLEENTIFCWFDLKKAFENHFRGTYKRPATTSDLQACIQKKGETSRSFLTRWLATRNECENVDNRTAMHAFIGGLQRGGLLRHKLTAW